MNHFAQNIIKRLPYFGKLYIQNQEFHKNISFPPGHFSSPIVSVEDIKKREKEIWKGAETDGINGITLNTDEQISLIREFKKYYAEIPFEKDKKNNLRYYFENIYYSYTDSIILYSMMRYFKPKKIIEVGSGYSSAVMLDTRQLFLNQLELTFIEPYPDRLLTLITEADKTNSSIIINDLQHVDVNFFKQLEKNDILFIDSSHVSKTGSDVNYVLFEILPKLKSGVLIHFHDVFYPFEYPKEWVLGGKNWNEDYLLRAFLMYNTDFKIILFSDYLHTHHSNIFTEFPLYYKNKGGNLWIQKQ